MNHTLKNCLFGLIVVALFFASLEAGFRIFSPLGSFDFIERSALQQKLPFRKKPNELRIFLFGESTIHGSYLFPESTIKRWMEVYLKELLGESAKDVRVINFGRMGVDSSFIRTAFEDTLVYKPDIVVVYSFHNDFIQLDKRQEILNPAKSNLIGFKNIIRHSAFCAAVNRFFISLKILRHDGEEKETAQRDTWYYPLESTEPHPERDWLYPDSEEQNKIYKHWENNILSISHTAEKKGIKLVLFNGLARYAAYEPRQSAHLKGLSEDQLKDWDHFLQMGENLFRQGHFNKAILNYLECLRIDPLYALVYYRLGQSYLEIEEYEQAKKYFIVASDHDVMPIRGPSKIHHLFDELSRKDLPHISVIPIRNIFEQHSKAHGFISENFIADQFHPTIPGQILMAHSIVELIYEKGWFKKNVLWDWDHVSSFENIQKRIQFSENFPFESNLKAAFYIGRYGKEALPFIDAALKIKPNSIQARSEKAWILWTMGQKKDAVVLYKQLQSERPKEAEVFFNQFPEIQKAIKAF